MEQAQKAEQLPGGARPCRRALSQVFVTLIIVATILGGLEYTVRVRHRRRFGPNSLRSHILRDRFTAWRNNPAYGRFDCQINSQGFRRDRDMLINKPADTVRVFLTGGSVAYGWPGGWRQVDDQSVLYNNQTISYYLERELNDALPSRHWEVINAAVVGYQLNLELAQTESVLLRYHPDCIIYLDGHNDLLSLLESDSNNYDPYSSTPLVEFDLLANPGSFHSLLFFLATWARENSGLFRVASDRLRAIENPPAKREPGRGAVGHPVRLSDLTPAEWAGFVVAQRQLAFYPHLVGQIRRILDLDGTRGVFLLQPELMLTRKPLTQTEERLLDYLRNTPALPLYAFQELEPEIARRMTAAAQQDGFVFVKLTDVFNQTSSQTFTDDCHLTPDGNRIVADRLLQLLKGMFVHNRQRLTQPELKL